MIPDVTPNGVFYLPPTGWLTSFYNPPYFSDCIESVINLIDKQEKATDKLNKLKKYLLQKLFI